MKFKKTLISEKDFKSTLDKLMLAIKNGDNKIEKMRCVYKTEESSVLTMLMPYDFVDLNPKPKIKEFYIYQVLDS